MAHLSAAAKLLATSRYNGRQFRLLVLLLPCCLVAVYGEEGNRAFAAVPTLNGTHLRVTAVHEAGFLNAHVAPDGKSVDSFDGYLIDMLDALAAEHRANFTYRLEPPTGRGSSCLPRRIPPNNSSSSVVSAAAVNANGDADYYDASTYVAQYNCGADDVNDVPISDRTTDMYLGMFYITTERMLQNQFTVAFQPPAAGALGMLGTATRITTVADLVRQQSLGHQGPACVVAGTAYAAFVQESFPGIQLVHTSGTSDGIYDAFVNKLCQVYILDSPVGQQFVLDRSRRGQCRIHGKPLGMIGKPLAFGVSQFAIGVRRDLPKHVVDTLSYWMNTLMTCNPLDPEGPCPEGNLASMYKGKGGTGKECGYVLFPPGNASLTAWAIALIVLASAVFVASLYTVWHRHRLKQQENRYKKRFVQQIARNIEIGPSPKDIPPEKLVDQVMHIGGSTGVIEKEDLRKWMLDIKLNFITQEDFDALWDAMDMDDSGVVDPVEFIVFLSSCGDQFEEVYHEHQSLPKLERLKLAARRLTNFHEYGEEGVLGLERKLDRRSRNAALDSGNLSVER